MVCGDILADCALAAGDCGQLYVWVEGAYDLQTGEWQRLFSGDPGSASDVRPMEETGKGSALSDCAERNCASPERGTVALHCHKYRLHLSAAFRTHPGQYTPEHRTNNVFLTQEALR